jgi:peptidoglycan/LPS O-acetylase OafA/YrhL
MTLKYRPDIDGLRAIAVFSVLLFHAGLDVFRGGFIGVDVFFVISGYLITSIIHTDLQHRRFSTQKFYARRVCRIFPGLFAVFVSTLIAAYLLLMPEELISFAKSLRSAVFFVSNIFFMRHLGYFDTPSENHPLLHTWSLSVEEQFYIFFPLLLRIALRKEKFLPLACAGLTVISFVLSCWATVHSPKSAFYLLPTRAWELLFGSVLALGLVPEVKSRPLHEAFGMGGLALIALGVFGYSRQTPFPGFHALVPCAGAALLIYSGSVRPTWATRILGSKPLVFGGLISYSLYLWHWPLLVFMRLNQPDRPDGFQIFIWLIGSIAVSILSWKYIETPFRGPNMFSSDKKLFSMALVLMTLFAGLTFYFESDHGLRSRLPAEVVRVYNGLRDVSPRRTTCHDDPELKEVTSYDEKCLEGDLSSAPKIAVWGDSFAVELAYAIGELAKRAQTSIVHISFSSCPPVISERLNLGTDCLRHNEKILKHLEKADNIKKIVLIANYDAYPSTLVAELRSVIRKLRSTGKEIFAVYPIPQPRGNIPLQLAKARWQNSDFKKTYIRLADFEDANRLTLHELDELVRESQITAIRPADVLCDREFCRTEENGSPFYFDHSHLSLTGARALRPVLERLARPAQNTTE